MNINISTLFRIEIVLDLSSAYTSPTNNWLLKLRSNVQLMELVFIFFGFWIKHFELGGFWPLQYVVMKVIVKNKGIDDNHKYAFYFIKIATKC